MATEKQKEAARHNLEKARGAQAASSAHSPRAQGSSGGGSHALSTADKDDLKDNEFAFPAHRKEPLTDARHVRNAVARFNQVEGVTDAERDEAWARIERAARRFEVDLSEKGWHELAHGGKDS